MSDHGSSSQDSHIAMQMSNHGASHANNIPTGGSGMAQSVGHGIGNTLKTEISFGSVGAANLDSMSPFGEGAFNSNPFDQIGDGNLVGPGQINAFQGMGELSNEFTKANLAEATGIVQQTGANIHGNTGAISQGGGRE